jgi:glycosyltransferase involved in cell wall biosynthesis
MVGPKQPIRILHVVGGMNRGGTETWLMHVLRNIDRNRFKMDFLVHTKEICAYDDEIRMLGSRIIPCLHPSKPFKYGKNFKRILCDYGPYDIVHSHVHHFSGYTLRLAYKLAVPVRIAHSHNDTSALQKRSSLSRLLYLSLMSRWIDRHATIGLAASRQAAVALFGQDWNYDRRLKILYCAIDLDPFRVRVHPILVRTDLGLPKNALVVGHVGRFDKQKNHEFILDIARELFLREPKAFILLVGDGPRRPMIERKAIKMRLKDRVIFVGLRSDVAQLMLGAMDVFIMPSLFEGLPLAIIEAQAAGLPIILSDTVTDEVDIVKPLGLVQRLSLFESASAWAEKILDTFNKVTPLTRAETLAIMEKTPFNIREGLKELINIYENGLG